MSEQPNIISVKRSLVQSGAKPLSGGPRTPKPPLNNFQATAPHVKSLLLSWSSVSAVFPNQTDSTLRSWIGDVQLPYCFNLGAGSWNFVAVLSICVAEQQKAIASGVKPVSHFSTWEGAINAALPPRKTFPASLLARAWNLSADQIGKIIPFIGYLPKAYKGNRSREILRDNAFNFLNARRLE